MFRMTYLWGNQGNRHKIHKSHRVQVSPCSLQYVESELSAFCTLCSYKMRKMCKVHAPRIAEICLFGFLHLLSRKKPKRCKIHIPRNMNYQHFRHDRGAIMLIMSIVQVLEIVGVMRVSFKE